ncbi:glutaredoxin domain-containing protein [Micromonospora sp. CPCC 206060]|uniref:glutaredoxin domain-containing protein n=1 Tax=Micromonospora sp. CPCC 206060 TaxID=3122406 RepID=UPI002FF02B40
MNEASDDVITLYSAPWCGHCHRLKAQLGRAGVSYREIDVDTAPDATERIAALNGGAWLIPTVILPDGSALINPSVGEIISRI